MSSVSSLWHLLRLAGVFLALLAAPALAQPAPQPGAPEVYRDSWDVPHIYAASEADGYFALGYAMAQDRMAGLAFSVLRARGTLAANITPGDVPAYAAMLASSQEDLIALDYEARLWQLHAHAQRAVSRLEPQVQRDYAAFIAGIAAWRKANPSLVPSWAPADITVADLVAIGHSDVWLSYWAGIGSDDCVRGGVEPFRPKAGPRGASNGWVLMPSRTTTGGAVLLSDPHGPLDGRFVYEYRLHAPGLESAGFAQGPMLLIARNASVGWAFTTGSPDVSDCYVVRRAAKGAWRYRFDGKTRPITRFPIDIAVKSGPKRHFTGAYTRHNGVYSPVIAEDAGKVWVVSTPYIEHLEGIHNAAWRMNHARRAGDLAQALDVPGMPIQNVTAADTHGDSFYIHAGMTPRRPPGFDWQQPQDGNTSRTAWRGYHPLRDLFALHSPAAGYIANNNVDPRFMYPDGEPTAAAKMPNYLLAEGWTPEGRRTDREDRFLLAAAGTPKFDEETARQLALDVTVSRSDRWTGLVKAAASAAPGSDAFTGDLAKFDGALTADSTGALKYMLWRRALRPELNDATARNLADVVMRGATPSADLIAAAARALNSAAKEAAALPQGLATPYGAVYRIVSDGVSLPMSGGRLGADIGGKDKPGPECRIEPLLCPTTLFAIGYGPPAADGTRTAVVGSRMMRLDFYSPQGIRSFTLQNPGTSLDPASPHATDQMRALVSQRALKPVAWTWEALAGEVKSKVVLQRER